MTTPLSSTCKTTMLSDDGFPDLIGTRLIYPKDKLSSHGVVRLAKYVSGLSFKALIP